MRKIKKAIGYTLLIAVMAAWIYFIAINVPLIVWAAIISGVVILGALNILLYWLIREEGKDE